MIKKEFDFDQFRADALKAMYAGKPLTGKDGVLAPLIENLLNAALEGEMDSWKIQCKLPPKTKAILPP